MYLFWAPTHPGAALWPGPPAPEPGETQGFDFALLQSEGRAADRLPREATRDKLIQKPLTDYRQGAVPGNREGGSFTFCLGFSLGCGRGIHFEGGVRNTKCIVVLLDTSRF